MPPDLVCYNLSIIMLVISDGNVRAVLGLEVLLISARDEQYIISLRLTMFSKEQVESNRLRIRNHMKVCLVTPKTEAVRLMQAEGSS